MNLEEATAMLTSQYPQVRDLAAWGIAAHDTLADLRNDQRADQERQHASDPDCERAMLATVWLAGDANMIRQLHVDDFLDPLHRWLYVHLRGLVEAGEPLDMVALLRRLKKPDAFAGLAPSDKEIYRSAIAELLTAWAPAAKADYYFRVLRTERLRRATGRLADAMRDRCEVEQHDPVEVLLWADSQIERLKGQTITALPAIDVAGLVAESGVRD